MLPEEYVNHILLYIKAPEVGKGKDEPRWMLETKGQFIVKSTWEYIKQKAQTKQYLQEYLGIKIAFLMWRT